MASSHQFVVRLAAGTPDGPYSSVLRIWSPAGKSDVYAGVRERSGEMKVSLHADGTCLAGLTSDFALREPEALAALGGKRHQSKWKRTTHAGSQFVTPLQFSLPVSEFRNWRTRSKRDPAITWIPAPAADYSVIVTCGFSGQLLPNEEWPGRKNGTHLIGTKLLPNGEKLWVLWQYCPTSPLELSMLAEARTLLAQPGMVHFTAAANDPVPAPRILIFKDCPAEHLLVILDAAAS
jgi:hypothetical protein